MRLSELLDLVVLDRDNIEAGFVADVRLVQDGPVLGLYGAALRVSGLILVEHRHVRLLGYERDNGPWLVKRAVRAMTGRVRFVPWDDVRTVTEHGVQLHSLATELRELHELPSRLQPASE
jgi:hypothetical protein